MILSSIVLALSLSIDSLGVGLSYGLRKIQIPALSRVIICSLSVIYAFLSLHFGKILSKLISANIANATGIIILLVMGVLIIIQNFFKSDEGNENLCNEKKKSIYQFAIKPLGITVQIIRDPIKGDVNKSGYIEPTESFALGLALSVDSIGVGIGSGLAGYYSQLLPIYIGLCQMIFLWLGVKTAEKISKTERINKKVLSIVPGIMFIFLAVLRML